MPGAVARPSKGSSGPPDQEDAFIRALNRFIAWAQQNTRTLVVAAVVLVLAVGGAFYWLSYQQSLEERASAELSTLQARIAQQARQGAAIAVTDSLQAFLQRFDGTDAAREARILLARQQLVQGQASQAVESIRPVARRHRPDTPNGFAARSLLADAQIAAGDTTAAISTLAGLAEDARFAFQRHQAAAERAALLADVGRLEEARAVYRRLAGEASGSEAEDLYAVRLGEVEARLASDASEDGTASGDTASGG